MIKKEKISTLDDIFNELKSGKVDFYPLNMQLLIQDIPINSNYYLFDDILEVIWKDKKQRFSLICKTLSTPKAFQEVMYQLKDSRVLSEYPSLLVMPYMDDKKLKELQEAGLNGIDLCGNGYIEVPGVFAVYRTGNKNRFTTSSPIKNIYRKNSSMVAKVFLSQRKFDSVNDVHEMINKKNLLLHLGKKKNISISTVSKALKVLEQDMIISKKDGITLLQPDKLLGKLLENYEPVKIKRKVNFKVDSSEPLKDILMGTSKKLHIPLIATGLSSVNLYAVMQRNEKLQVYCTDLDLLMHEIPGKETDIFPNLEILETKDKTVFFDGRLNNGFYWASPVQAFLELMNGDKRDRETAEQIREYITNKCEDQ